MTAETQPLWNTIPAKLLRWLVFLPIGIIAASLLQVLPVLAVNFARAYKPELNFLTIMLAVIVVSILSMVAWMWCLGVFFTPYLSCRVIAPNSKVAAVVFGTVFCVFQGIYMLTAITRGDSWVFMGYQFLFSAILLGGTVAAYQEVS